jgi:zinc protease
MRFGLRGDGPTRFLKMFHGDRMKFRRLFVVLNVVVLVTTVGGMLRAQTVPQISPPAGVQRITSVEGTTEYRLANGLRVLLSPDLSSAKVTVNITYLVGSRHESYGETGMARVFL